MAERRPNAATPEQARRITRIIWASQLVGIIAMTGAITAVASHQDPRSIPDGIAGTARVIFIVSLAASVLMPPLALFARGQAFKAGWEGDVVRPESYVRGTVIALAIVEMPAMIGLVSIFLSGEAWPGVIAPTIAMLFLLLLFPKGRAMFPPSDPYAPGRR